MSKSYDEYSKEHLVKRIKELEKTLSDAPTVKHLAGLEAELDAEQAENARLREANLRIGDHHRGEYWMWQNDEEDHLESLTCPILISAEQMRTILAEIADLEKRIDGQSARCKAIWDYVQSVSPWSESNDMAYEDEVITGVGLLVQDVNDLKAENTMLEERNHMLSAEISGIINAPDCEEECVPIETLKIKNAKLKADIEKAKGLLKMCYKELSEKDVEVVKLKVVVDAVRKLRRRRKEDDCILEGVDEMERKITEALDKCLNNGIIGQECKDSHQ